MSADKGRRLGRGLEALLGRHDQPAAATVAATAAAPADSPLREVPVADVRPNPFQPRTEFRPEEIEDLKESLAQNGLLQPITVRPAADGYELVAGERRLRAAVALGWTQITAIVRAIDDQAALTLALVENLQRSDLNPIEEAEGFKRLASEFHLTHEAIAQAVGKNRTTVVNSLRLLGLPDEVRKMVQAGTLSAGHARAILALPDEGARINVAYVAHVEGLSVRNLEKYVKSVLDGNPKLPTSAPTEAEEGRDTGGRPRRSTRSPELKRCEDLLRTYLQTDVRVEMIGPLSGNISIRFYGTDDLVRLTELMGPDNSDEAH